MDRSTRQGLRDKADVQLLTQVPQQANDAMHVESQPRVASLFGIALMFLGYSDFVLFFHKRGQKEKRRQERTANSDLSCKLVNREFLKVQDLLTSIGSIESVSTDCLGVYLLRSVKKPLFVLNHSLVQ